MNQWSLSLLQLYQVPCAVVGLAWTSEFALIASAKAIHIWNIVNDERDSQSAPSSANGDISGITACANRMIVSYGSIGRVVIYDRSWKEIMEIGNERGTQDGFLPHFRLNSPKGLCLDQNDLWIADSGGSKTPSIKLFVDLRPGVEYLRHVNLLYRLVNYTPCHEIDYFEEQDWNCEDRLEILKVIYEFFKKMIIDRRNQLGINGKGPQGVPDGKAVLQGTKAMLNFRILSNSLFSRISYWIFQEISGVVERD